MSTDADVTYEWQAQVRVAGIRNGWHRNAIVDTPWFTVHDNALPQTVARVARDMFIGLCEPSDDVYVSVMRADGNGQPSFYVFSSTDVTSGVNR